MVYVLEMTSPSSPDFCDHAPTWLLFQRVLPDRFFEQLSLELGLPSRQGIYSVAIVIWLMIYQRLHSKGTLSSTVHWLARHAAQLPQAQPCLRVRQNRISTHTGGYCQARQKLPTLVVTRVMDQLFTQLQQQMRGNPAGGAAADVRRRWHHATHTGGEGAGRGLPTWAQPTRRESLADHAGGGLS